MRRLRDYGLGGCGFTVKASFKPARGGAPEPQDGASGGPLIGAPLWIPPRSFRASPLPVRVFLGQQYTR